MILKVFGPLCVMIAMLLMLRVIVRENKINTKQVVKCNGLVVDNILKTMPHGAIIYNPVIEYEHKGKKERLTSKTVVVKPIPLGEKIPVYIDSKSGKVIERTSILTESTLALLFGALGMILVLIGGQ